MDRIESEGRSVDEAIQRGLAEMGARREEVEVEILDQGGGGLKRFFGGGRPARVRMRRGGGDAGHIHETVAGLLKAMDLACQVNVALDGDTHVVNIDTAGADGLLIGRKGDTLIALQHIVDRMVNHGRTDRLKVIVDVGGYRERRLEALRSRAIALSNQVKATGRERSTDPLPPSDRRIVHVALANDPTIRTYTIGDGTYRVVVIAPADARSREGGRDRHHARRRPPRMEQAPAAVGAPGGEDDDED